MSGVEAVGALHSREVSEAPSAVPMHLRDAHYKGATALGHVGYAFPHDDSRGWSDQVYAPGVPEGAFYQSDARGAATFERRADEYWEQATGRATARRFADKG